MNVRAHEFISMKQTYEMGHTACAPVVDISVDEYFKEYIERAAAEQRTLFHTCWNDVYMC